MDTPTSAADAMATTAQSWTCPGSRLGRTVRTTQTSQTAIAAVAIDTN